MRLENWQDKYAEAMLRFIDKDFAWGENDCVTFVATIVDAISDLRVTDQFKRYYKWSSSLEAARITDKADGLGILVAEFLGPPCRWTDCSTGDVILATNAGRQLLAIHDGHTLVTVQDHGIGSMPLEFAISGWRV